MKKSYLRTILATTLTVTTLCSCIPAAAATYDLDDGLSGGLSTSLTATSSSLVSSNTDSTRKQVSTLALSNGYYVFAAHENKDRVANVTFASVQEDRATLGISVWDAESNEIFYIERVGEGNYVTIAPAYCKSLVLNALLGANCAVGQSVTLHRKTAGDTASWWLPVLNSDGSYTFVNKASGLVMDLANGDSDTIGNGLLCYTKNGWLPAQGWYVFSVGDPHAEQKTPDYLGTTDASSSTGTTMYVNTSSAQLRVRRSPSTSASVIGKLKKGSVVIASKASGNWTKVISGSISGWVSSDYLREPLPGDHSAIAQRLNAMINGSYGDGVYKAGTKYTGAYSSEQCKGFARQVTNVIFEYVVGSTKSKPNNYQINIDSRYTKLVGSLTSLSTRSDSAVQQLFSSARPGDFVQVRRSHGGSHSMIFLSCDNSGVTVYEANVDGNNGIQVAYYSWGTFRSKNASVSVYSAQNYYLH